MARYSGIQAMEGVPVEEWVGPGGETGLEEPMWRLGFGGGPDSYPERPDEPVCIYYLRTGYCGYGDRCRFNHPRDRSVAVGTLSTGGQEYPERVGQPVCQYYMRNGTCKFGASCKYDHPKNGVESPDPLSLNFYGYPLRPGERECSYYLKTGQCKFGITCKFDHPQQSGIHMPPQAPVPGALAASAAIPVYPTVQSPVQSSQQYGLVSSNWPIARPTVLSGSYVPGNYGPLLLSPGVVPVPGWTPYSVSVSPVVSPGTQPTGGAGPVYGLAQLSPSATAYTGPYLSVTSSVGLSSSSLEEHAFPERPGQPECRYYLRTGDCKFGSTCKYHHPPEWNARKTDFMLSLMGLPLRPGTSVCSHYAQNGVCKFGPSCKFDHPMSILSYSPSTSSLTDMPVAPYPVGSATATLAPSSSSSDLRPEILSGSKKDGFPSQVSSTNSSSSSVGSIFSNSDPLPSSSVPGGGNPSQGSKVRPST
ncbi:zinc finger CCCH domain-containing protein 58-like [Dorcoceras hygrometricum]|uniref:Zinc finger CCCH domain-containing protein 58-like n=1 Tax=Dorcoceras hygrometricum TaxID=472368 RepID=A0A2Z7AQD9_9LAMI|nr:zinc finger CCCH domain-containing protein 58-like [Dorcoceras hygrometricum]